MVGWHHQQMDMSLSKLQELVMDREPVMLQSMGLQGVRHNWATELNWLMANGLILFLRLDTFAIFLDHHLMRVATWKFIDLWNWMWLSHVQLFTTPWTIQSMEFSSPEYCSGLPFPSPGYLPNPGIEPRSPALQADSLPAEPQGKPYDQSFQVQSINFLS